MKSIRDRLILALIAGGLTIAAVAAVPPAQTLGGKRIYVCEQGYDPPCRFVGSAAQPGQTDWAELIAANRAYLSGVETPVIRDESGAIAQCGSGHGQSACCKIIGDAGGKRYVQCG